MSLDLSQVDCLMLYDMEQCWSVAITTDLTLHDIRESFKLTEQWETIGA